MTNMTPITLQMCIKTSEDVQSIKASMTSVGVNMPAPLFDVATDYTNLI